MRFDRLDLNLLVVLDALIEERSVSRASERVCLSQSATSSALGRLRDFFGDDLLVLQGRQMVPTPRALELAGPVREILDRLRDTVISPEPFQPASSERVMTLIASDYTVEVLLADALLLFAREAPGMRFEITPPGDNPRELLERRVADISISLDVALAVEHPRRLLFEDDYVVVGWSGNPALSRPIDRDAYFGMGHITVKFGRHRAPAFEEWYLRSVAAKRRIEVVAPSFMSVPGLLVDTQRIATMHRRLAARVGRHLPLVVQPLPLDVPPIRQMVQWHRGNDRDPAIRWVVDRLGDIARRTGKQPATADERSDLIRHFRDDNPG